MKLRNKKTGEIVEAESCNTTTGMIGIFYHNEKGILTLGSKDCFETLAELNEEWEDYKPAEPLIKNEKICNAVRAWAEANNAEKVAIQNNYCLSTEDDEDVEIVFATPVFDGIDDDDFYAIAELCGEEGAK